MTPMPSLPGDVAIQPLVDPQQFLPLDINAAETQTGRLMLGVGVNSDAGLVGNFVLDEQNFSLFRLPRSWEDVTDGVAFRGDAQRLRSKPTLVLWFSDMPPRFSNRIYTKPVAVGFRSTFPVSTSHVFIRIGAKPEPAAKLDWATHSHPTSPAAWPSMANA